MISAELDIKTDGSGVDDVRADGDRMDVKIDGRVDVKTEGQVDDMTDGRIDVRLKVTIKKKKTFRQFSSTPSLIEWSIPSLNQPNLNSSY